MEPIQNQLRPEDKNWAMLAHLLTLLGYVMLFGHWIPPLVIYLTKKDSSPFVAAEARESLNFQITVFLALVLPLPLLWLVITIPFILVWIVLVLLAQMLLPIFGAIRAADGVAFRYPLTLRLVS